MFDIGWQELFIVAILALIVVGPKDLPQAIRTITTWIRKAKMMTREFQAGVNEMVREAELDGIKESLNNPADLQKTIADTVDPDGELFKGMSLSEDDLKADPKKTITKNKKDDVDEISMDEPLTIDDAIEMGVIKPEEDALPEQAAMAVKRKPKAVTKAKPKVKAKPKPKAKTTRKPRAETKS